MGDASIHPCWVIRNPGLSRFSFVFSNSVKFKRIPARIKNKTKLKIGYSSMFGGKCCALFSNTYRQTHIGVKL
jgi:hypothetical protein